jgi:cytochrome c
VFCLLYSCSPPARLNCPSFPAIRPAAPKLFQTQQCVHCHAVNGAGGKVGIDLGRSVSRKYTPALLASTMWNHGPVMWGAMESAGIETPKLSEEDAGRSIRLLLLGAIFRSAR